MRLIAVGMMALMAASCQSPEDGLKAEAETAVKEQLREPASAQFEYGPEQLQFVFVKEGLVCGEVNARNGFGGYTGKQRFAFSRAAGAKLFENDHQEFSAVHSQCLAASAARTKAMTDETNEITAPR